jgi:hypothetical protein
MQNNVEQDVIQYEIGESRAIFGEIYKILRSGEDLMITLRVPYEHLRYDNIKLGSMAEKMIVAQGNNR